MKNEITLNELAKEIGVNKSQLAYYQFFGFLKPITVVSKTGIFDRKRSLAVIKKIEQEKKKGKKLKEIKEKITIK